MIRGRVVTLLRRTQWLALALAPTIAGAQQGPADLGPVVPLHGIVRTTEGQPLGFAQVAITSMNVVTQSREDGHYTLNLPAAVLRGQTAQVTARALGFKALTSSLVLTA